jgi:signal transduction histidine kinase
MLLSGNPATLEAAQRAIQAAGAILGLVVVALVVRRWLAAAVAERRVLAPLWLSLGTCLLLTVSHVLAVFPVQIAGRLVLAGVWISDVVLLAVPFGFLVVALGLRMTRAAVSELVLELGSEVSLDGLRSALARVLGDPSVEVGTWDEESKRYRDPAGNLIQLPDPGESRVAHRIELADDSVAVVIYDAALATDPKLVQTIGSALRVGMERAQLIHRLHGQLDELRASRARIAEAGDAARRRLERDLHDGAQQRFVLLSMTLASTLRQLEARPEAADLQAAMAPAADELQQGLAELRELARGIHPTVVTERGLAPAVHSLVARMPMPVEVVAVEDRFPAPVEMAAYYVVCEALTNVARHSGASSARVSVSKQRGRLVVEVVDDGSGGASPGSGSGLRGMTDRVAVIGGSLSFESPAGGGTRLRAEFPCA